MKDRKVNVEREKIPLFCNLVLEQEMSKEDMKKNKASGSLQIVNFTRGEAEKTHRLLGEMLKK